MTRKILIFGNSHAQSFRQAFRKVVEPKYGKENAMYIMSNFLATNWRKFETNSYLRDLKFQEKFGQPIDLREDAAELDLVIIAETVLGSGILHPFGQLLTVPRGEEERVRDYTPKLPLIVGEKLSTIPQHTEGSFFKWRLRSKHKYMHNKNFNTLKALVDQGKFRSITWVVSPDMPEAVARVRFGDDVVESGLYAKHRHLARKVFFDLVRKQGLEEYFVIHPEDHILESGFCDNRFRASKSDFDVHVHADFYKDAVEQVQKRLGFEVEGYDLGSIARKVVFQFATEPTRNRSAE